MIANSVPDSVKPITIAQQQFGFALLATLQRENPDQNLLISPISVAMALTMAYNRLAMVLRDRQSGTLCSFSG